MTQSPHPRENRASKPWFPNTSLSNFRQEMNDLIESFLGDPLAGLRGESAPRVDVIETSDAVEITTDVPGYRPEEIDIDVSEKHLTISGKHADEGSQEDNPDRKYHRMERRLGSFSRSVWLPCPVNEDLADAQLANGILKIRLPKQQPSQRRKVPVRPGGPGAQQSSPDIAY